MYVTITSAGYISRFTGDSTIATIIPIADQALDQISGDSGFAFVCNKALCSAQRAGERNTVATAVAGAILGEPYEGMVFYGPIVVVAACNSLPDGSYAQLTTTDADTILQYFFDAHE